MQTCANQQEATILFLTLLNIDPTAAIRQLFKRTDIAARKAGQGLLVSQCRPVEPEEIYWNRRINDTCFDLVPMLVEGKIWFLLEGTDDLVADSGSIECKRPLVTGKVHVENGNWKNEQGTEIWVQTLHRPIRRTANQFLFQAPAVIGNDLLGPGTSSAANEELNKIYRRRVNNITFRLLEENIVKAKDYITTKVRVHKDKVANTLDELWENTGKRVFAAIKHVIFNVWTFTLLVIAPLLLVVILVIILYCYCKFRLSRSAASATANRLIEMATRQLRGVNHVDYDGGHHVYIAQDINEEYPIPGVYSVLHRKNRGHLPVIQIEINGRKVHALLDTGAGISYLPVSQIRPEELDVGKEQQARAANGSVIRFLGTTSQTIKIGEIEVDQTLLVSHDDDCPSEILLGVDFIRNMNKMGHPVSFDMLKKEVQIGTEISLVCNVELAPEREEIKVAVCHNCTVNPTSEAIIPVKLVNYRKEFGTEFMIADNKKESEQIYAIARSVVSTDQEGKALLQLVNPSATPIKLFAGQALATATIYEQIWEDSYTPPEADWTAKLPLMPQPTPPDYKPSNEIDLKNSIFTENQKSTLRNIIDRHPKAFVGPDGVLGCYNGTIRHRIDFVKDAKMPAPRNYRVPLERRHEVEKQVREMESQGIIRPSSSPFSAPIVMVRKADGESWRFCIDFRQINNITEPVQSILPNLQELLDVTAENAIYTTLDFASGFHQIPLEEEHCERTAFASFMGVYEYIRMPMGLKGSPGTFQRIMHKLIKPLRAKVFCYIDDIILTSPTPEQHLEDIEEILTMVEESGMKLKPSKAKFGQDKIKFLGFIVSAEGIHPDPEKTVAITNYPKPKNVTEVRAFLGLASFYRRFIKNFSKITTPLTELTKKDSEFHWEEEQEKAFEQLKFALVSSPVLAAPKLGFPFVIETDASGKGVGAVLMQARDRESTDFRVIAYASRVYNKHEKRYPAIELEALGLIFAVTKFRPYIDGAETTIITDHSPLKALLYRTDLQGRLAKYQIILQEYNVTIVYKPGKTNVVADALSRHHPLINAVIPLWVDLKAIKAEQQAAPELEKVRDTFGNFENRDGVIYKNTEEGIPVVLLPKNTQYGQTLAEMVHGSLEEGAHLGRDKTLHRIKEIAVWPGLEATVRNIVAACPTCQHTKDSTKTRTRAVLHELGEVSQPFERVHCDFIGPLAETERGNKYILVFTCAFSKFVIAEPTENQSSMSTIRMIADRLFARFGIPKVLVTDRGTNFLSKTTQLFLQSKNCEHRTSTPYHHSANGQVERANQTIEGLLRPHTADGCWDVYLQKVVHAYNTSLHATTRRTPFEIVHTFKPGSPVKNALNRKGGEVVAAKCLDDPRKEEGKQPDNHAEVIEYEAYKQEVLKKAHERVKDILLEKTSERNRKFNQKSTINDVKFEIGQKILLRKGKSDKLSPPFAGPFEITGIREPNLIIKGFGRATRSGEAKESVVHKNRMPIVKHLHPETPGENVTRFTAVVLKEYQGYTLMYSKKFGKQLVTMEGSAGPQQPGSVFHIIVFEKNYTPGKYHLNNANCTGWNIELAPEQSRIEAKYLPSLEAPGHGEVVLRILYSDPWMVTGRIGDFKNEIIPFEVISMDQRQKQWLLQEKDAGGMVAIEAQVALDGLLMIGGQRLNRGTRNPVGKAQRERGRIVNRTDIRFVEDATLRQILVTDHPFLFPHKERIMAELAPKDEEAAEGEVESVLDDLEIIALDELDD
ncbi:hypothetical protein CRE_30552 [Caenorhabditis remanei]|uniref:RNA-directed DNA polymerase n=1 Tax=Caenorhabditis remanei TaxID=31234 RepID=E3NMC0_CAERE|nr:hypothetical protein CRE_30552 [Caenorhabditis remanei]